VTSSLQLPQALPRIPSKDEVVPIVQEHLESHVSLIETITKTVCPESACFDNVIKPLAQLDNFKSGSQAVIAALQYTADKETQKAVDKVRELWRKPLGTPSQRAELFELIKAVKEKDEPLHFEEKRLVEKKFQGWTQSGHGVLEKDEKERLTETRKEIGSLSSDYHRNLREYDAAIWLTDEELVGIPKKDLDRHPVGEDGRRHYSIRGKEDVTILMKYASNPSTRKKVEAADASKNSENSPNFKSVIQLRSRNAQLMGFKSHAAYRLPYRVAKSTEWIEELLDILANNLIPYGLKEFQLVEEKKRSTLDAESGSRPVDLSATKLESWDVEYYRRLIEEEAAVDQDKIAEYFPLRHTVGVILELFSSFLQLRFVQLPTEMLNEARWSEDVEAWSVWDERPEAQGAFIGYLYIDILERPNKYKGNQCVTLQPVS
jgi:metallopeptidase MepB